MTQHDEATLLEQGHLAIAAHVVERTDEEIEDAVRKRLVAEAVKAEIVTDDMQGTRRRRRRRRLAAAALAFLVLIITIIVIVVTRGDGDGDGDDFKDQNDGPVIMVALQLDQFPQETAWNLTCTNGQQDNDNVVVRIEIPPETYNTSFQYVMSDPIPVAYGHECLLRVTDVYGDGFCCRHGDGYFQVLLRPFADEDDAGIVLLEETGGFGAETMVNFTIVAPSDLGPGDLTNSSVSNNNNTSPSPQWLQKGQDVNGQKAGDRLGYSVSMATINNGASVVVAMGAPGKLGESSPGYVTVRQYDLSSSTDGGVSSSDNTRQLGQVISGPSFDAELGSSLSLADNGTVMAIGGHKRVMVYQYDADADWWNLKGSPITSDDDDGFGVSTSISGDGTTIAIGAPFSFSPGGDEKAGSMQVYSFDGQWTQLGETIFGKEQGGQLGSSVSMSSDGRTVAVGSPSPGAAKPGYSEVYKYYADALTKEWFLVGDTIAGDDDGDESGTSVSVSSDASRVAIGSPHITGGTAGYVRVLEYNSTDWNQVGRDLVDISPGAAESVSLSADGFTVAMGARTAGHTIGRVRVFRQYNTTCEYPYCWHQVGEEIFGDAPGGSFGDAVSLSNDGTVLAVGAPFVDESSGTVRVVATD